MTDGFKKGSGAYTCIDCGKLTRKVAYQDSNEMCYTCEQIAILENGISDLDGSDDQEDIEQRNIYIKQKEELEAQLK